jgi:hypothetical protein
VSWLRHDFTYMPDDSFAILPNGEVLFRESATPELRERFMQEWPEYVKRMEAKHAEGRFDSSDLI